MVDETRLAQLRREEYLLLQELAQRNSNDPLKKFQPHEKQREFISAVLHGRENENWFFAANRAGKTDAGAYVGATLARFGDQSDDVKWVGAKGSSVQIRDRATSGWVSALDFPTSRDVVQPKYFNNNFVPPGASHEPFIPEREIAEWRVSDQILKLKNGSIIGFKSCETGRVKYQGTEKDWVHLDEEHPEDIYTEISIRVGSRRLRVFGTATLLPPVGQAGGVSWMFPKMIQPWLEGKQVHYNIFTAAIYDNPHIPVEEIRKLESLFPEGSLERRIRLNGELLPGLAGARAYPSFDARIHAKPQPEIVIRRPLCWTWDFNVNPMVSLVGQMERLRSGKILYRIYKELILEGSASVPDMCDYFVEHFPRHGGEIWIFGDSTSNNRSRQTGKSDYTLIANQMRQYGSPVRFKVPPSNPSVPDRVNAVNRVLRDEDAEYRIEIDPSCTWLRRDLEGVLRDARGGIKKSYNPQDHYSQLTHPSDALGYWISYVEPVKMITRDQGSSAPVRLPPPGYGHRRK